jgi:glycogen synthase
VLPWCLVTPGDRPLRIALQTLDYPPDRALSAIGLYTQALAADLTAAGHVVHVLARGDRDGVADLDGVTVHRIEPARPVVPSSMHRFTLVSLASRLLVREWRYRRRLAQALDHLIEREGIDLVEACDSSAEALMYRPARHPAVPFVVRLHAPTALWERFDRNVPEIGRLAIRAVERRLLLAATHLSAPSLAAAALLRQEMRLGQRPIAAYPNPPTFRHEVDPGAAPPEPGRVLFVGRLTIGKGVVTLVEAIPLVLAERPEARFVFVGADGPSTTGFPSMQAYLLHLVPAGCRHAVTFTGHLTHEEVARHFRRAAVCVFPSAFETFGYVCLEAMTYGKAIIASDRGGMAELLDGGRCGLLFTPPDADRLAQQVLTLLRDPAAGAELGERARRRALSVYAPSAVLEQVERFYRRAIGERSAAPRAD